MGPPWVARGRSEPPKRRHKTVTPLTLNIGVDRPLQRQPWPLDKHGLSFFKQTVRRSLSTEAPSPSPAPRRKGAECKNINYDPLVMSEGIAGTDDPMLLFRSPSYALSFVLRLQGK